MESKDLVSPRRALTAGGVALLLVLLLATNVAWRVRQKVAQRYLERGDVYLTELEYASAVKEYQSALHADPSSQIAISQLHLAQIAPVDIAQAVDFFQQHNVQSVLTKLAEAKQPFNSAPAALKEGLTLYSGQQFVYAQYPLQEAVKIDPGFPEAWHYLGLTYQELAKIDPLMRLQKGMP